jgi:hypothetical protein
VSPSPAETGDDVADDPVHIGSAKKSTKTMK